MPVRIKTVFRSVAMSSAVSLLLFISVACIMLLVDVSDSLLLFVTIALVGFNSYLSAYISTQFDRNNGIIQGIECGILCFASVVVAAVATAGFDITSLILVKLLICLACGSVGGVVGVNTKKTSVKM